MITRFPISKFGLVLAISYILVALLIVRGDRRSTAGGWITLSGIGAYLITLPVSAVGEKLGVRPDYRRNVDMAVAIGICAFVVYLIGAGVGKVALSIFNAAAPQTPGVTKTATASRPIKSFVSKNKTGTR